jgi:hypothetical protein
MKHVRLTRLGTLGAAVALLGCSETREPVGLPLLAEGSYQNTTYSGDATVVQATILDLQPITLVRAGPLPESGGAEDASLLTVGIPGELTGGILTLSAEVAHAATIAQGNASRSEASVAKLEMTASGNAITAEFLRAHAEATCEGGNARANGGSELARVMINGHEIAVTGEPNQTVNLPGLRVVIDEQNRSVSGSRADMTVNALHVTAFDPLTGRRLAEVIISQAHADISCGSPPPTPPVCQDFVTGGGWITGTPSGARGNVGVAGGIKHGDFWGHLNYVDHGANRLKVKGTGVTGYERLDATTRRIEGTAEVNGGGAFTYEVFVTDLGEPGRSDRFQLRLSNGYAAAGSLEGGNMQLHGNCP